SVEAAPVSTRAVTACSAIGASAVGCLPVETGRICPSGRLDQGRLAPKERIGRIGEFQNGPVLTQQMLPIFGEREARHRSIVSPTEVAWTSALWGTSNSRHMHLAMVAAATAAVIAPVGGLLVGRKDEFEQRGAVVALHGRDLVRIRIVEVGVREDWIGPL